MVLFEQTQKHDKMKIKLCQKYDISLEIIDVSGDANFHTSQGEKYLKKITSLLDS